MKLSDFLQEKKVIFKAGKVQVIKPILEGEVIFYTLDKERMDIINEEVIQKLEDNDSKEKVSYKIFPYLTNIENDVSLDEFLKMVDSPPNNEFAVILDEFFDSMENLFDKADTVDKAKEKSIKLSERLPEQIKPVKSSQEIRNDLLQELGNLQDSSNESKSRRKEIFIKLAKLEE